MMFYSANGKQTEMELWYAAYVCLCPLYSASHMSAFCGHICRRGHSQIGSVWMCVHKREREKKREISEPYTPAISHIHVSFCHLFICMAVTDLIMALAPLQPVLPMQHSGMEFFNVCACSASRVHAHARPHHQLLPLSAVTNMTETIALIICTPIAQFVDGDAVSCWECFNCRLANEGIINGKIY